jgi:hypothetical protein
MTLSAAHQEDLLRRLDVDRDDPEVGSPWAEVKLASRREIA